MNWEKRQKTLSKEFTFGNFLQAIDFVNKVAIIAEELKHHPDITIYNYKHVRICTTTHDTGELSTKDFALTKRIDALEGYNAQMQNM